MAKVTVKITGGALQELEDVETVKEARRALKLDKSYVATVNGEPQDEEYELTDFEFLSFAPAVKGGKR